MSISIRKSQRTPDFRVQPASLFGDHNHFGLDQNPMEDFERRGSLEDNLEYKFLGSEFHAHPAISNSNEEIMTREIAPTSSFNQGTSLQEPHENQVFVYNDDAYRENFEYVYEEEMQNEQNYDQYEEIPPIYANNRRQPENEFVDSNKQMKYSVEGQPTAFTNTYQDDKEVPVYPISINYQINSHTKENTETHPTSFQYQSYSADSPFLVQQHGVPANRVFQEENTAPDLRNDNRDYVEFTEVDAVQRDKTPVNNHKHVFGNSGEQISVSVSRTENVSVENNENEDQIANENRSVFHRSLFQSVFGSSESNNKHTDKSRFLSTPSKPADISTTRFQPLEEGKRKANLFNLRYEPKSQTPYIKYTTNPTRAPLTGRNPPIVPDEKMFNPFFKDLGPFPDLKLDETKLDLKSSDSKSKPLFVTPTKAGTSFSGEDGTEGKTSTQPSYTNGVYFMPQNIKFSSSNTQLTSTTTHVSTDENESLEDQSTPVSELNRKLERDDSPASEREGVVRAEEELNTKQSNVVTSVHEITSPRIVTTLEELTSSQNTGLDENVTRLQNVASTHATNGTLIPPNIESRGGVFMDALQNLMKQSFDNETAKELLTFR